MKKISQLALTILTISLILPSIAMASWWNPFSWHWKALFNGSEQTNTIQTGTTTATTTITIAVVATTTKKSQPKDIVDKPIAPIKTTQVVEDSTTTQTLDETWEELEARWFADANQKGWTDLYINNNQGETRYYLKENNKWTRKNTREETANLCNGNYTSFCSKGQIFICPSVGDGYCEVPKTDDQKCQEEYGINSIYNRKKKDGTLICDCKAGTYWNQGQTGCIYYSGPQRQFESDGGLDLSGYNGLNVLDYIKNSVASLNKPVQIINAIVVGFSQGSSNFIQVIDGNDTSSLPDDMNLRIENINDYTNITNELTKYDRILVYGFGAEKVKFNILGNGGSYESYQPVIDVDALYKCSKSTSCKYSYEMGVTKIFEKKLK